MRSVQAWRIVGVESMCDGVWRLRRWWLDEDGVGDLVTSKLVTCYISPAAWQD